MLGPSNVSPELFEQLRHVPYIPGPLAEFNTFPLIGPGAIGPLQYHPPEASQVPEIMRLGVGYLVTFRRWGLPVGTIPLREASEALWKWAKGPNQVWGMGRETTQLNEFEQYDAPAAAAEVIHEFDRQRSIPNLESSIVPTGAAFELTRFDLPTASVGVLEYFPTCITVEALDDVGAPIFSYSGLNGERPCLNRLVHPDPAVTVPLTWEWRIKVTHNPGLTEDVEDLLFGIPPGAIPGDDIVEPWNDMRNGNQAQSPQRRQLPVLPRMIVRFFVVLSGPTSRFRVEVGGRLGGYWQVAGRRGAAVRAATQRFV